MGLKYEFTLPSSSGADFHSAEHLPLVVYFYVFLYDFASQSPVIVDKINV